jgi:hypothetical protein
VGGAISSCSGWFSGAGGTHKGRQAAVVQGDAVVSGGNEVRDIERLEGRKT